MTDWQGMVNFGLALLFFTFVFFGVYAWFVQRGMRK